MRGLRMKETYIRYLLCIQALCIMISITACSKKDSGLYYLETDSEEIVMEEELAQPEIVESDAPQVEELEQTVTHIYVHVCGAVNMPGVYELDSGQRIFAAIEAAGGFREDAAGDYVNLAMELGDGMKIFIPTCEEVEAGEVPPKDIDSHESSDPSVNDTNTGGKVNINTAGIDELGTIPGIGPTKAASILTYRETVGLFKSTEDIMNVSGIGNAKFESMKSEITV